MTEHEEWRGVVGFETYYQVSSLGRVRSLSRLINGSRGHQQTHRGRIMRLVRDRDGYPRVILRVDGQYHTRLVHRLVCEAFSGPSNVLHREVDHIDHDRANGRADNLRWVSHGENIAHRQTGAGSTRGEGNGNARLTNSSVLAIRSQRGAKTAKALGREYSVTPGLIYDVWSGKRWGHVQ